MKRSNFISAVVYATKMPSPKSIKTLSRTLEENFTYSEIILCFDCDESSLRLSLNDLIGDIDNDAVTLIFMGRSQGIEAAMNAGIDAAIGDFILEIDDLSAFDFDFVLNACEESSCGADVVMGECKKSSFRGKIFYPVFNRFSAAPYKLTSTSCSLVSRRAINRVRCMSDYAPYRKAAYAACGLKVVGIETVSAKSPKEANLGLAMDSLALYTDAFYKISFGVSVFMALASFAELIYVLAIYFLGLPIGGWTTTMLAITFGFLGVFIVLTFILKYVALLLRMNANKQGYLIEGIVKRG